MWLWPNQHMRVPTLHLTHWPNFGLNLSKYVEATAKWLCLPISSKQGENDLCVLPAKAVDPKINYSFYKCKPTDTFPPNLSVFPHMQQISFQFSFILICNMTPVTCWRLTTQSADMLPIMSLLQNSTMHEKLNCTLMNN